jgi:hypothetical protein
MKNGHYERAKRAIGRDNGFLVVQEIVGRDDRGHALVLCVCRCGGTRTLPLYKVKQTKGCEPCAQARQKASWNKFKRSLFGGYSCMGLK